MSAAVLTHEPERVRPRGDLLDLAARLWLLALVAGQWLFAFYIIAFYDPATLSGDYPAWNADHRIAVGYVAGDVAGNLAFAGHTLGAGLMTLCGTLQLTPFIRNRAPFLHRLSGRVFLLTATVAALSGLYMIWIRRVSVDMTNSWAVSLDAILILLFGALAYNAARAGDFVRHPRWAMRTFMVASAVWFIRLDIMLAAIGGKLFGGPKLSLTSPTFHVLDFACYLLPLAVLELYWAARDRGGPGARRLVGVALLGLTAAMGVGIGLAWTIMWAPRLS